MVRRLQPDDAGYVALFSGRDPDAATLDEALLFFDFDEPDYEFGAWGEGTEVLSIDSTVGPSDPGGLGFVAGWSQKKG